ncbi:MAG: hypothetical protein HC915_17050, partial [Anaerolineae bacterium]|nr:hypothetical protein [Anaerolineae bacterium]
MPYDDYLFRGDLASLDPDVAALIDLEALRQARKLIMIPSESSIPQAVREAVGSVLGNIYAEGYPPEHWRWLDEGELLDVDVRLAEFRRSGSPRYYKGTEIAELVETLAQQRTAQRFANARISADRLYVNVQPLSGAPANSAVYTALARPGDTIMGFDLSHGGHLTHGSPANLSGKWFRPVPYTVRREDQVIDMAEVARIAREARPKLIIAGGSAYARHWDFAGFRAIADEVG